MTGKARNWAVTSEEVNRKTTVPTRHSKITFVFLKLSERQYAGVIKNDEKTYVVSDFNSDCQPDKDGWYLCLTPKKNQRPVFVFGGKPVFTVKILSAVTGWKSGINEMTIIDRLTPSPNDFFEKERAMLFFGENGDSFIWIRDPNERKNILQELNGREEEVMDCENPWLNKHGIIFSPRIMLSQVGRGDITKVVFE